MSCCGQRRDAMRVQVAAVTVPRQVVRTSNANGHWANPTPARPGSIPSVITPAALGGEVALQCRERARIQVRGPVTGRTYLFEAMQATVVDRRDAEVLLRSLQFLRSSTARG